MMKTAIVTGGASGIGAGIVRQLVAEDWEVVVADLDSDKGVAIVEETGCDFVTCDVAREDDIIALIEGVQERSGRIDAIVSNAGISEFAGLAELTLADWNRVIATNLTAAFLLAQHGEEPLRQAKGAMVLIASTRAHMSEKDTHAYSATKGGLVALTHSLAISLGPDVRVNCISPGWIDVSDGELSAEDHAQHPAGRVGTPEDIAHLAAYLLSEKAGFVTGAEFTVDGGMTRKMIYS
ncbi:SDR family oxidoreductase [Rhizobium sp. EC-SD404]|uniref:SDR family oxidoreductase n=1 Tax=Rhizobium sp. EC-SD404 TaxID=2038389 RepID=UPI001259393C|nr:SDR family oxidoreductase [Rhizobium sp. EC-SD404]VVT31724.1 putative enzyme [Rhizobium sp. EC-SD404]